MGKLLDTTEVEYCYLNKLTLYPSWDKSVSSQDEEGNSIRTIKYISRLELEFELKDLNKKFLRIVNEIMEIGDLSDTKITYRASINTLASSKELVKAKIAEVKQNTSGYVET